MSEKLMTPIDEMINTDSMQMMKAMIPYLPTGNQPMFTMCAKMMELMQTMNLFNQRNQEMSMMSMSTEEPMNHDPMLMIQEIGKYCNPATREHFDQMSQMFTAIQMMQFMQENDDDMF